MTPADDSVEHAAELRALGWLDPTAAEALRTELSTARQELDQMATRMRRLAAELTVGWDLEPNPDARYLAYGEAFKEAARRILAAVDALSTPPPGEGE